MISGLGVYTGAINPRAVGVLWQAGEGSLIDDVRFLGGHGTGFNPYNTDHTADSVPTKRWDGQYPSLWVTHGGRQRSRTSGHRIRFAQAGFYVSDTKTPGHVYELSNRNTMCCNEMHLRPCRRLGHQRATNRGGKAGESPDSLSLEFDWSNNTSPLPTITAIVSRVPARHFLLRFASTTPETFTFAMCISMPRAVTPICDENGCGTFLRASKYPYENAIQDVTDNLEVR